MAQDTKDGFCCARSNPGVEVAEIPLRMETVAFQVLSYAFLGLCLGLAYAMPHALNMRLFDKEWVVLASLLFLARLSLVGLSFIRVAQQGWAATLSTILSFLGVLVVDFVWGWWHTLPLEERTSRL